MANEKIYLGLNIEPENISWAVANNDYQLCKYDKRLMWGVYNFDEAQLSEKRRTARSSRRRYKRQTGRVSLCQELFAKALYKKDKNFLLRISEGALTAEDAKHRKHYVLFEDANYTDKDYYTQYPTVHHLICELIKNKAPHDVRLVYLACSYLLAYRGHFFYSISEDNVGGITDFSPLYNNFYSSLTNLCGDVPFEKKKSEFEKIIRSKNSLTLKKKAFNELMFAGKAKNYDNDIISYSILCNFISGGKIKISKLFANEDYEDLETNEISTSVPDLSEMLEGKIDELQLAVINSVKAIYDWSMLIDILNGCSLISEAMVNKYNEHNSDLKKLKHIFIKYLPHEDYRTVFAEIGEKSNYKSYVYNAPKDEKRPKNYKKCTQEEFCKFTIKYLNQIKKVDEADQAILDELITKCADSKLCPKLNTTDNRVVPYQLYYHELKLILENAKDYLPFLNDKDEYGTVADKILAIMKFKIPYYVGPLVSSEKSPNAWLERKAEGNIRPWNFKDLVDEDACEKKFIERMTGQCKYVVGQKVLAKRSILNCKYNVLNELNHIVLSNGKLSVEAKQAIYTELCLTSRNRVTKKKILSFLVKNGYAKLGTDIAGIDDIMRSSMQSYLDFEKNHYISDGVLSIEQADEIINRITISTDIRRLRKWISTEYPHLSAADVKYLSGLKYQDYGDVSKSFLEDIYPVNTETGEIESDKNIITMLWETNETIEQLLGTKYRYTESIEYANKELYGLSNGQATLQKRLADAYVPVAMQKATSKAIDIVKDLKRLQGKAPDKIFIRTAKDFADKPKGKNRKSKKEQILAAWGSLKDRDIAALNPGEMASLKKQLNDIDEGKLNLDKYYLYFMQLGRCMYSGAHIPFDELENSFTWNIDHIWPQAKVKDNSLDNKVLVDLTINTDKGKTYPIAKDIREAMADFWGQLYHEGLISDKKYQRLIRQSGFSKEELAGFILAQITETRQSTKAIVNLFREYFPDSTVIYLKNDFATDFRREMELSKHEIINNFDLAKDAYLNLVLGNVYTTRFTSNPLNFVENNRNYSLKMYQRRSDGSEVGMMMGKISEGNSVVWDPETSFDVVKRNYAINSVKCVRDAFRRKSGNNGGLFDNNPLRKGNGQTPKRKDLPVSKYGGYNCATISFYSLAVVKDVGPVLFAVELLFAKEFLKSVDFAKKYAAKKISAQIKSKIGADDVRFPFGQTPNIIKANALLELDGYRITLGGKTLDNIIVYSAESLFVASEALSYADKIGKVVNRRRFNKDYKISENIGLSAGGNSEFYDYMAQKCMSKPFSVLYNKAGHFFEKSKEIFEQLSIEEQVTVLAEMIKLLTYGRKGTIDLKLLGGSANACIKTIPMNLYKMKGYSSLRLINQSPTGLIEYRSCNLLKLTY